MLMDYTSWPFFSIFTSILLSITGLPLIILSKWFPLVIMIFWALFMFIILKKFLTPQFSLIGVALFICGSWTRQQYFGPQSFAFILFLAFMYFFICQSFFKFSVNKRSLFGLALLTFIAAIFSHALTSLLLLLILVTSYSAIFLFARSQERRMKSFFTFCCVCFITLVAYMLYISPQFFNSAFNNVIDSIGTAALQQLGRLPGSQIQQMTNFSTYLLILIFSFFTLLSLFRIIAERECPKSKYSLAKLFGCIVFYCITSLWSRRCFSRFYFCYPFSFFVVDFLKNKVKILGVLLLLVMLLGIFALYGSDSYRLATEPELLGAKYCAHYLPDGAVTLYSFSPYVRYFDPLKPLIFVTLGGPPFSSYNSSIIRESLNQTDIIIQSRNQINYYEYYFGIDPFSEINLVSDPALTVAKVYDNGNFSIYWSTKNK